MWVEKGRKRASSEQNYAVSLDSVLLLSHSQGILYRPKYTHNKPTVYTHARRKMSFILAHTSGLSKDVGFLSPPFHATPPVCRGGMITATHNLLTYKLYAVLYSEKLENISFKSPAICTMKKEEKEIIKGGEKAALLHI